MKVIWLRRVVVAACAVMLVPVGPRFAAALDALGRERAAAAALQEGLMLRLAGRAEEATAAFRRARALLPDAPAPRRNLAQVEASQGRTDAAVSLYRELLASYPEAFDASLYREVGVIELRAGRLEDARRDLGQAAALDPFDWLAAYYLGHAYARLGDTARAAEAWRRVLVLNPEFRPAHVRLRELAKRP